MLGKESGFDLKKSNTTFWSKMGCESSMVEHLARCFLH